MVVAVVVEMGVRRGRLGHRGHPGHPRARPGLLLELLVGLSQGSKCGVLRNKELLTAACSRYGVFVDRRCFDQSILFGQAIVRIFVNEEFMKSAVIYIRCG